MSVNGERNDKKSCILTSELIPFKAWKGLARWMKLQHNKYL